MSPIQNIENLIANRYEGFSSEDVGKFVKKTEDSSPESKESKGTESSPTKENENTNGNVFHFILTNSNMLLGFCYQTKHKV